LLLRERKKKKAVAEKTVAWAAKSKIQINSAIEKNKFDKIKSEMTLDYIFGRNVSKNIDFSKIEFVHSRKTGRIKQLEDKESGKVLFTFRPNGTIAPTPTGASMMISTGVDPKAKWILTVIDGVSEIIAGGKTIFCKHVVSCSDALRPAEDVVIVNEKKELLAVGHAVIGGPIVKQFKRGQAVKVREGTN